MILIVDRVITGVDLGKISGTGYRKVDWTGFFVFGLSGLRVRLGLVLGFY